ncbi:hypothetical protein [Rhodonellum sp.]|uniref:hypothetical protein n=1 Tax=Rhodonellum sp. TaxID=2231180 RepID=UPI002724960E|nr:hypothetical protein [Rhodonellum sp.]MDO9554527.1 hypothetical protein [Rhodonellum sp.]
MAAVTYGASKIELGVFSAVDGSASGFVEIPVYKDTFTMTEAEPNKTQHYQQGRSNPRLERFNANPLDIAFQIMDTDPDVLLQFLGGTVATVNTKKVWRSPKTKSEQVKALRITCDDGSIIVIPKFNFYARPNLTITDANINLIDISGSVNDTGFVEVPDITWGEAGYDTV